MSLLDGFKKNALFDPEIFFSDIENKVYEAIKKDIETIVKMAGTEELYAMALVADEDCVSLYFAANTLEKARAKDLKYTEMLKARLSEEEIKARSRWKEEFCKMDSG